MNIIKHLKRPDIDRYFTVAEAAMIANMSSSGLRNHLSRGALTTFKFKNLTLLSRREVEKWLEKKAEDAHVETE